MERINDYNNAFRRSIESSHSIFHLKDGTIVSGKAVNYESKYDDPNGIGCIDVIIGHDEHGGYGTSVFADQFDYAEFDD